MATQPRTRRSAAGIHVGIASIVMLFAVLCLTIFSVLALMTARNEYSLAEKSAQSITAYYAADSKAVALLDQLNAAKSIPTEIDGITIYAAKQGTTTVVSFAVRVDEAQQLHVELVQTEQGYRVQRWQMYADQDWIPDDSLNVWQGDDA